MFFLLIIKIHRNLLTHTFLSFIKTSNPLNLVILYRLISAILGTFESAQQKRRFNANGRKRVRRKRVG